MNFEKNWNIRRTLFKFSIQPNIPFLLSIYCNKSLQKCYYSAAHKIVFLLGFSVIRADNLRDSCVFFLFPKAIYSSVVFLIGTLWLIFCFPSCVSYHSSFDSGHLFLVFHLPSERMQHFSAFYGWRHQKWDEHAVAAKKSCFQSNASRLSLFFRLSPLYHSFSFFIFLRSKWRTRSLMSSMSTIS